MYYILGWTIFDQFLKTSDTDSIHSKINCLDFLLKLWIQSSVIFVLNVPQCCSCKYVVNLHRLTLDFDRPCTPFCGWTNIWIGLFHGPNCSGDPPEISDSRKDYSYDNSPTFIWSLSNVWQVCKILLNYWGVASNYWY